MYLFINCYPSHPDGTGAAAPPGVEASSLATSAALFPVVGRPCALSAAFNSGTFFAKNGDVVSPGGKQGYE